MVDYNQIMKEYDEFHGKTLQMSDSAINGIAMTRQAYGSDLKQCSMIVDAIIDSDRLEHASDGLVTEAAEIKDILKKAKWGKKVPLDINKVKDEAGDLFWYFWLLMKVKGLDFAEILKYNTTKLKERYNNV